MRARLRLAILECDTPLPETSKRYGGYGGVFKALLNSGAQDQGCEKLEDVLDVSIHHIESNTDDYPDLEEIDSLLLTGSSE